MVDVHLTDVYITCTCVGVSRFRRKEKLLRYYPDKQNCDYSDECLRMANLHLSQPNYTRWNPPQCDGEHSTSMEL
jgi:hypothetical protein